MSPEDSHRESSTDDNQTGFPDSAIEMSRDRFECFACGFAAEDREEFGSQGLALACPDCQSLRVEHVFTSDDDEDDLVADGGVPTCETCGETFTHETVAGPGEARRSCGCPFVPEFEVPDDTENAFANAAIRAANVTGDAETAALIREDERGRLVADGGTSWFDLTAFKRDCLQTLARMENDNERMHGLGMKSRLEERYGSEINHGQIYPNLDDLVAAGLVEKKALDKRTNSYTLTDAGWRMLREQREAWAELEIQRVAVADGGEGE